MGRARCTVTQRVCTNRQSERRTETEEKRHAAAMSSKRWTNMHRKLNSLSLSRVDGNRITIRMHGATQWQRLESKKLCAKFIFIFRIIELVVSACLSLPVSFRPSLLRTAKKEEKHIDCMINSSHFRRTKKKKNWTVRVVHSRTSSVHCTFFFSVPHILHRKNSIDFSIDK